MIYKINMFFSLILLIQCTKNEPEILTDINGVIVDQPYVWKVKLSDHDYIGFYIEPTIYYNDGILMGAENEEGNEYLVFIDTKEGEIRWKLDYYDRSDFFALQEAYQYNDVLIEREHDILYNLDLKTGSFKWIKNIDDDSYAWISGIDSLFFLFNECSYPTNEQYKVYSVSYSNINDGSINPLVIADLGDLPEPDLLKQNMIGGFRYVKPFKDVVSGDYELLCYYGKNYPLHDSEEMESQSYVGLYNFSKKIWVYERVELGKFNWLEGFTPTIIGNRFYHTLSGGITECRDLNTGAKIWRKENNFQYSYKGFVIADGKMIVMDDLTGNLIALNINYGNELWRTKTAASPSMLYELNGVVYFTTDGDGNLYAIDISEGKVLWRISSPDEKSDRYNSFKCECKLIPGKDGEKGKIIVSSFTHGYCYEAAR
jgi:outer membrane protein assembly factor BamB